MLWFCTTLSITLHELTISFGQYLFQTCTIDKTLNPVWNTYGEFAILKTNITESSKLIVDVWDEDMANDDSLGKGMILIDDLKGKGE